MGLSCRQFPSEYHGKLLYLPVQRRFEKIQPHLCNKKVVFYQVKARVNTYVVAMANLNELGYELSRHLLYSLDLVPGTISGFQTLRIGSCGKRFGSYEKSSFK